MTFFSQKKEHEEAFAFPYAKQVKQQSNSCQEEQLFLNKQTWPGEQQPAFEETWLLPSQHARIWFINGIFSKTILFAHVNLK